MGVLKPSRSGHPITFIRAVLRRSTRLLREVAWRAPEGLLDEALRRGLRDVVEPAAESTRIPAEERTRWEDRLAAALAGQWPADRPALG